jgi:hypothetical protein
MSVMTTERHTAVVEMLTASLAEARADIARANARGDDSGEWCSLIWRSREGALLYALNLIDGYREDR